MQPENQQQARQMSKSAADRFVCLRSITCRYKHPASVDHFHHRRNEVWPSMKLTHQPDRLSITILPSHKSTDSSDVAENEPIVYGNVWNSNAAC